MAIPQNFIDELLARTDVVDVVGRHVPLRKAGANFSGLCPFHAEKTPSFTVSPSKQFYHCFGCGRNGNAIGFLMDHLGLGFVDAVTDLAQRAGLQVPSDASGPMERERAAQARARRATLTEVLEKAGAAWRRHLRASPRAIDYLRSRGVSGEIARRFGLGYAPDGWRALASVFADYNDPLLLDSGLVIEQPAQGDTPPRRHDRFRDRIMFPIRNVRGECIGFGGRVLDRGEPKYLNSPETPVFSKGRELYGLFEARQALRERGHALVTEGYMDVVALAQLGFPNAVATLGTACTADHLRLLFRFTDQVVFSFDGDAAGRRAARRALEAALPWVTDTRRVRFLFLPAEHDPDSFIREHGADAFARQVSDAVPLSRFLVETARTGNDLDTPEGRARMAAQAQPLWQALPDGTLKRQVLAELAELIREHPQDLATAWHPPPAAPSASGKPRRAQRTTPAPGASTWRWRVALRPSIEANARNVARLLLSHSPWWDSLTTADHELLCALDDPLGALFRWLDAQAHEHGAQPLAALQGAWTGTAFAGLADELARHETMQPLGRTVDEPAPTPVDLQRAMLALRLDAIDQELKAVQALPPTDPTRRLREDALILEQFDLKRRQQLGAAAPSLAGATALARYN